MHLTAKDVFQNQWRKRTEETGKPRFTSKMVIKREILSIVRQ